MKNKLLAFIAEHPRCSFDQIESFFKQNGYDYKGHCNLKPDEYENLSYWYNWNEEAFNLIIDLVHNGQISFYIADKYDLFMFSKFPRIPIAKSMRSYKSERWLPIVISVEDSH